MAAHKMTTGQSQTLGCNIENWSLKKKGKYQKKQDWGWSAPSAFFWGDGMDLSSSFFLGMEAIPKKKKGQKKGDPSFFFTDGPRSPFFLRLSFKKLRDPPFFPFFFVDCVFREFLRNRLSISISPYMSFECTVSRRWFAVGVWYSLTLSKCMQPFLS